MTTTTTPPLTTSSPPVARPVTQPYPEPDRGTTTARLLAELHSTTDEREQKALRAEVVVLNMGVARAIAHRYRQRGLSEDDLVQAAYVGLVKAVNGFDPSHERDFLSYAVPTVTGEVKRYFRDFGWAVRPPRRVQELQGSIAKLSSELTQKLGRSREAQRGRAAARPRRRVGHRGARRGRRVHAGLARRTGGGGRRRHPRRPDARRGRRALQRGGARGARPGGTPAGSTRDRRILELRFFEGWTQEQIAQDIGVTQMQVSRLLSRILKDLRAELT